jgi:hypothetical protein
LSLRTILARERDYWDSHGYLPADFLLSALDDDDVGLSAAIALAKLSELKLFGFANPQTEPRIREKIDSAGIVSEDWFDRYLKRFDSWAAGEEPVKVSQEQIGQERLLTTSTNAAKGSSERTAEATNS